MQEAAVDPMPGAEELPVWGGTAELVPGLEGLSTHSCTYAYMHMCLYMYMLTGILVSVYIYIYAHVCIYVYVYMHICMNICV